MDAKSHWEAVYGAKGAHAVSWYRPHLEMSLAFIKRAGPGPSAAIVDVGGGESTLADDLLAQGYENLTVFDISATALEETKKRLGANADRIRWIAGDVTEAELPQHAYDIWHDRAVFHFLTSPTQRAAYVWQASMAVKPGGHLIIATFAASGPP